MRLFLQIDIGDWKQRNYQNPLVPYASSLAPDLMGTDIDNESESTVIDLVIKLIDQAESLFVFIVANPDTSIGSADKMLRYLLQHETKVFQLVMLGQHEAIEKSTLKFNGRFLQAENLDQVKKLIRDFAEKIA
ncbi:MAG TPA: hypothetical protein VFE57_02205 [Cyclobacteriaceae bacterium]|jgi:TPP-dependent 2-oxoacid decarboxylase|nr:hypothetical protein [Cyclobacteriaceae bacterium]